MYFIVGKGIQEIIKVLPLKRRNLNNIKTLCCEVTHVSFRKCCKVIYTIQLTFLSFHCQLLVASFTYLFRAILFSVLYVGGQFLVPSDPSISTGFFLNIFAIYLNKWSIFIFKYVMCFYFSSKNLVQSSCLLKTRELRDICNKKF